MSNRYEHNIIPKSTAPNSPHTPVDVSMMTHYSSSASSVSVTGEGYYVGAYGSASAFDYASGGGASASASVTITVTVDGVSVPSLAQSDSGSGGGGGTVYAHSVAVCTSLGGMYPFSKSLYVTNVVSASASSTNTYGTIYYWM